MWDLEATLSRQKHTQGGAATAQRGRWQKDQEATESVPRAAVSPSAGFRRLPEGPLQTVTSYCCTEYGMAVKCLHFSHRTWYPHWRGPSASCRLSTKLWSYSKKRLDSNVYKDAFPFLRVNQVTFGSVQLVGVDTGVPHALVKTYCLSALRSLKIPSTNNLKRSQFQFMWIWRKMWLIEIRMCFKPRGFVN